MQSRIISHGTAVTVATDLNAVVIDASEHAFLLESPTYGVVDIGASRAGLAAAVGLALDDIGAADGERELAAALLAALESAAMTAEFGCPTDRYKDRRLRWTPLAYSRRFLASRFLIEDVEKLLPCRVVLAHIEDGEEDACVDAAAELAEHLLNWRAALSPTGEVGRPLNGTLAEFGEVVSPYALWGLRRVPLTRRAVSATHVEVLGGLGRHARASQLSAHMRLIENATVDELNDAFARIPRAVLRVPETIENAHALPELLATTNVPPRAKRLSQLMRHALDELARSFADDRQTALPPIPLPKIAGVRFLSTVGDVVAEGVFMHHCVATRSLDAILGRAYLFHVDSPNGAATVQVNAHGRVVESRGPNNADSQAAHDAAAMLNAWGAAFDRPHHAGDGDAPSTRDPAMIRVPRVSLAQVEKLASRFEWDPQRISDAARLMLDGVKQVLDERGSRRS